MEGTRQLLSLLWKAGYTVSRQKAQTCQERVQYLGFHLCQGQRQLGPERKQAVCSIPTPTSRRQVREFLGAAGSCRMWIPNFSVLPKPLDEATKVGGKGTPDMGVSTAKGFRGNKGCTYECAGCRAPRHDQSPLFCMSMSALLLQCE